MSVALVGSQKGALCTYWSSALGTCQGIAFDQLELEDYLALSELIKKLGGIEFQRRLCPGHVSALEKLVAEIRTPALKQEGFELWPTE